jgi:hypothetical protein
MPQPKKKPDVINIVLMIGLGAVIIGLVAWAATRSTPQSASETASAPPPVAEVPPPVVAQDGHDHEALDAIARITVDELQKEIAAGTAVVIDVRDQPAFIAGHIPGALQIPLSFVQGEVPYFPRDKRLVAYCT